MVRAGLFLLGLAAILAAASVSVRAADVGEADILQIKRDVSKVLSDQQSILQELKAIREELNIVRIRCSS
jgi:hypothetical protein